MCDIMVSANDLWDYCMEYRDELQTITHEVARNIDTGTTVYVTVDSIDNDFFDIIVMRDDEELFCEPFTTEGEAFELATYVYQEFVDVSVSSLIHDLNYLNDEDRIFERETELDEAVQGFLDIAYTQERFSWEEIYEIKDHFLEYLATVYREDIYRPCEMEDENGEVYIEDYPYMADGLEHPDDLYEYEEYDDEYDFEFVDEFNEEEEWS